MPVGEIDRDGTWLSHKREKSCGSWGESLFFGAAFADSVSKTGKVLDQRRAVGAGAEPRAGCGASEHGEHLPFDAGSWLA